MVLAIVVYRFASDNTNSLIADVKQVTENYCACESGNLMCIKKYATAYHNYMLKVRPILHTMTYSNFIRVSEIVTQFETCQTRFNGA